jgi:hypothetical protein
MYGYENTSAACAQYGDGQCDGYNGGVFCDCGCHSEYASIPSQASEMAAWHDTEVWDVQPHQREVAITLYELLDARDGDISLRNLQDKASEWLGSTDEEDPDTVGANIALAVRANYEEATR